MYLLSFQTLREFRSLYYKAVQSDYNQNNSLADYTNFTFPYAYHCHEATLTFAFALRKTIKGTQLYTQLHIFCNEYELKEPYYRADNCYSIQKN